MAKDSAKKQPNAIEPHPVLPEQVAERRRFEDALEDDEVYEALTSLREETEAKQKR